MAIQPTTTPAAQFNAAQSAFQTVTLMRSIAHTDDDRDNTEDLIAPYYARMVAAPAQDFSDVRMKLAGIVAEAGSGLVDVEDLAFIARDLDDLLGRAM